MNVLRITLALSVLLYAGHSMATDAGDKAITCKQVGCVESFPADAVPLGAKLSFQRCTQLDGHKTVTRADYLYVRTAEGWRLDELKEEMSPSCD